MILVGFFTCEHFPGADGFEQLGFLDAPDLGDLLGSARSAGPWPCESTEAPGLAEDGRGATKRNGDVWCHRSFGLLFFWIFECQILVLFFYFIYFFFVKFDGFQEI